MPIAKIQAPDGRIITLEVPEGATQDQIMAHLQQNPPPVADLNTRPQLEMEEPSFLNKAAGVVENLGQFASGVVAEPVAGVAGTLAALNPFADEGAGARTVKNVRSALTTQPKSESGISQQRSVGEALKPAAEAIKGTEEFLGGNALELTGSPAIAAAAATLPTAALELLGLKGSKRFTKLSGAPTKRQIKKAVVESAPEISKLKEVSRQVFNEIDESGVKVKPESFNKLVQRIDKVTTKMGRDIDVTPAAEGAMKRIRNEAGSAKELGSIDTLREVAKKASKSADSADIGKAMVSEIDNFLNTAKRTDFVGGSKQAAEAAKKFESARKLWGRAKRAETIDEAIIKGTDRAAGAEAGIRNELNTILNSKTKSKFFPPDELAAMRKVVKGNFAQNFTKMIGKLGISVDRAPNMFQSIIAGGGAGALIGGGTGAFVVPVVGTISKQIAKTLATNKANFLTTMTRAGTDAEKIAKAYLSTVPKAKRRVKDLADLLSDPKVDITTLETIANKTIQDALDLAKGRRQINLAAAAASGSAAPRVEENDNGQ
jgi:hypothetical protein